MASLELFILASTATGCVSICGFHSLVAVPVGITSSAVGLKICAITARMKKYKSIIKKEEEVLLRTPKSDTIEVLISKFLSDSYIIHAEFVSVDNVLKEYNEMKQEIKNPEDSVEYAI